MDTEPNNSPVIEMIPMYPEQLQSDQIAIFISKLVRDHPKSHVYVMSLNKTLSGRMKIKTEQEMDKLELSSLQKKQIQYNSIGERCLRGCPVPTHVFF